MQAVLSAWTCLLLIGLPLEISSGDSLNRYGFCHQGARNVHCAEWRFRISTDWRGKSMATSGLSGELERRDRREARSLLIFPGITASTGERDARSPVPTFVLPIGLLR